MGTMESTGKSMKMHHMYSRTFQAEAMLNNEKIQAAA